MEKIAENSTNKLIASIVNGYYRLVFDFYKTYKEPLQNIADHVAALKKLNDTNIYIMYSRFPDTLVQLKTAAGNCNLSCEECVKDTFFPTSGMLFNFLNYMYDYDRMNSSQKQEIEQFEQRFAFDKLHFDYNQQIESYLSRIFVEYKKFWLTNMEAASSKQYDPMKYWILFNMDLNLRTVNNYVYKAFYSNVYGKN